MSDANLIDRLWQDKKLRKKISSWFATRKGKAWRPTEIYPTNGSIAFTKIPSTEFQQGIFRTEIVPSRMYRDPINVIYGCRAGHWRPRGRHTTRKGKRVTGACDPGALDVHRIDVPRSRIAAAMRAVARPPARRPGVARRAANPCAGCGPNPPCAIHGGCIAPMQANPDFPTWPVAPSTTRSRIAPVSANPLLMTVGMPPLMNPGQNPMADFTSMIPFLPGQDIPFQEFQAWVHQTGDPMLIDQLTEAERHHKKFHGGLPEKVGFAEVELGGTAQLPPTIMTKAGSKTAESYRPHNKSNKGPSVYVHEYEDEPPLLFGGSKGAQFTLSPMVKSAYVDDWFRG